jgi:SAM-dependent methyltransferase
MKGDRAKRMIGKIYSATAEKLYEPIVVRRAFPLFGGNLPELAVEQGRRAVAGASGGPILDMPVGTGFFTSQIAGDHDGLLVGCDIAWGMVEQTMRAARSKQLSGLAAVQGDAHSLPFDDGCFRAIVCHNGLQVMPGLSASIREMARVLAPGGTLYATVITVALGRLLPRRGAAHLPTLLRSGFDVADELSEAGLYVTSIDHERFATLLEAVKPEDAGSPAYL